MKPNIVSIVIQRIRNDLEEYEHTYHWDDFTEEDLLLLGYPLGDDQFDKFLSDVKEALNRIKIAV